MKIRYFLALFLVCAGIAFGFVGCATQAVTPAPAPVVTTQPSGSTTQPTTRASGTVTAPTTQPGSTVNPPATPQQISAGINQWLSENSGWITAILTAIGGGVGVPILHLLLQATGIIGGKTPLTVAQLTSLGTQLTGIAAKLDPKDAATIQEIQSVLNVINAATGQTTPPSA